MGPSFGNDNSVLATAQSAIPVECARKSGSKAPTLFWCFDFKICYRLLLPLSIISFTSNNLMLLVCFRHLIFRQRPCSCAPVNDLVNFLRSYLSLKDLKVSHMPDRS